MAKEKDTRRADRKEDREEEAPKGIHEGTVRVVKEADIEEDPRLVAAGAVVGQLYDFSNLPFVKDGRIEDDVEKRNQAKIDQAPGETVLQPFTSEAERKAMGFPEDAQPGDKIVEGEYKKA
jgi:hypothetical protein